MLLAFASGVHSAFADPADEVSAVVDRWSTAFNANDVDALINLYTPDAILVGSTGLARHEGRDAVRGYFARLAHSGDKVVIEDRKIVSLGDNIAYATGFYEFSAMREGELKKSKAGFSMIFVKQGNDWLIAHHHSSVRSSPPPALPVRKI
ncbi:MAG: SgcJ/EcaC family oxidoreductase [Xanthobacteraceae bacterium]